jgi:hypothetical protein
MDQYQRANAVEKVDGYYLRIHPTMTPQAEFDAMHAMTSIKGICVQGDIVQ